MAVLPLIDFLFTILPLRSLFFVFFPFLLYFSSRLRHQPSDQPAITASTFLDFSFKPAISLCPAITAISAICPLRSAITLDRSFSPSSCQIIDSPLFHLDHPNSTLYLSLLFQVCSSGESESAKAFVSRGWLGGIVLFSNSCFSNCLIAVVITTGQ